MLFYRAELRSLWAGFTLVGLGNKNKDVSKSGEAVAKENADRDKSIEPVKESVEQAIRTKPIENISAVYIELEEAIQVANQKNLQRPALLASLQTILRKYKNSHKDFAEELKAHVQSQLIIYSSQPLSDEELEHLWLN